MPKLPDTVIQDLAELTTIKELLEMDGHPASLVQRQPASVLKQLLAQAQRTDWHTAFFAALTSGASVNRAESIATEAAALLAARRKGDS